MKLNGFGRVVTLLEAVKNEVGLVYEQAVLVGFDSVVPRHGAHAVDCVFGGEAN